MSIAIGNNNISLAKIGSEDLSAIYLGNTEIGTEEHDDFPYDYVVKGNFNEIDILYTTDTHLGGLDNDGSYSGQDAVFNPEDVGYYKDKLWSAGIPTFCVDCGDGMHGYSNTSDNIQRIVDLFNGKDGKLGTKGMTKYLAVTYGNHEGYKECGYGDSNYSKKSPILGANKIDNFTACNFMDVNYNLIYPAYRTVKVGKTKIAIISIAYPSPNGGRGYDNYGGDVQYKDSAGTGATRWTLDEDYRGYDTTSNLTAQKNGTAITYTTSNLYSTVQQLIDYFTGLGFDYIFAAGHIDRYDNEDYDADNRFYTRAEYLIKNTHGLSGFIPGHGNVPLDRDEYKDAAGNLVPVVEECGAAFHNIGRIRLKKGDTKIYSYLLDDRSDLEVIN